MIWGGAEVVMLVLESGCKYRLSLAERFDCTETIKNQLLADSYQPPQMRSSSCRKASSGLPLILHYGELYAFTIYHNIIIIEIKCTISVQCSSVQSLSCVRLFETLWQNARPPYPSPTPGVYQTHVHWVGDAIQPSHPLLSRLQSFPASYSVGSVFSNEAALCIRWPKYWSFSFSISPSNEHSGLISFRMDWLDLLVVQGTLKSLLQHHTTVQKHQFFSAQLSL